MHRPAARLVILVFLVLTLWPTRADASFAAFWDWLDQLSGPGPFHGPSVSIPLVCGLGQRQNERIVNPAFRPVNECLTPRRMILELERQQAVQGLEWRRTVTLALNLARFSTDENNLDYVQRPANPGVNWFKIGPSFVWHVNEYLDIHTSIEWNRLTSKGDAFEAIGVTTVELVGVTLHPFADGPRRLRGLSFVARTTRLMRSLDAGEFGAIPGSYQTGKETQLRVGIGYDFWALR
jgi:hypothetical protein